MMKRNYLSLLVGIVSIVFLLTSCSKDKEPTTFGSSQIKGMFYYYEDESQGRIRVLDPVSKLRRGYTLDASVGITLQSILEERSDELLVRAYKASVFSPAHPDGYFIKPYEQESYWLLTSNVLPGLVTSVDDDWSQVSSSTDLYYAFKMHEQGEVGGEKLYAIESLYYPGSYISHVGHPIQGTNTISYLPFPDEDNAPKWRLFKPTGTFFEGNPNLRSYP